MRIAVTGASGFIGKTILGFLQGRGHDIVALGRRCPDAQVAFRPYELSMPSRDIVLEGVQTVVHCAYDMRLKHAEHLALNAFGGQQIATACFEQGATLLNISSVLASRPSLSWYAKSKATIEVSVRRVGGANLRFGVINDFKTDPAAKSLSSWIRRMPGNVVPVPRGWIWLSSLGDLLDKTSNIIEGVEKPGDYWLAADEPISMSEYVRRIAQSQGFSVRCIQVPTALAEWPLRLVDGVANTRSTMSYDAVRGLRLNSR